MPSHFGQYVGIDYSGAATPEKRSATLQVYRSSGRGAQPVEPPNQGSRARNWNRIEIYHWLGHQLDRATQTGDPIIIGIDHGFSFPIDYFQRYQLNTWNSFLEDFVQHWPTDQPGATVQQFRDGSQRSGDNRELRLTERWTSSAKSVFQFDVQGSVAKSTHAGLPFLNRLRKQRQFHCWPFDGWDVPEGVSVVSEVFPSLFRQRFDRESRTVDQQDAYAICRWLEESDRAGHLANFFHPPLSGKQRRQAKLEGWILGVY